MNTTESELLQQVGSKLKALRHQQDMSPGEVKAATGISITDIEDGKKDIKLDALAALCDHYRISMIDFFKAIERQLE